MPDFLKTSVDLNSNFIRGAARLMWAGITIAFPASIGQIVNLSTFDPMANWKDLGATKTGITITVNNTEETFDVDQIYADIDSRPTSWECRVGTALAEMSLDRLEFAWEGSDQATVGTEIQMGVGQPTSYTRRRLAVLYPRDTGKIRAFIFRIAQKMPQESSILFAKTGEQQTVAVQFRALADLSVSDVRQRFFMVYDQELTA